MPNDFRKTHNENLEIIYPYIDPRLLGKTSTYRYICLLSEQLNKTVEIAQKLIKKY